MESIRVSDYMHRTPLSFSSNQSVAEVSETLINRNVSGAPVVNETNEVIGFVSQQDCLHAMLDESYYSEGAEYVVDVMCSHVFDTCENCSIIELAQQMMKLPINVVPVVDSQKTLIGVISRSEVLRALSVHLREGFKH